MPDLLSDEPTVFAAGIPAIPAEFEDVGQHSFAFAAIEAMNQVLHGHRAPSGLMMRSVVEDGASTESGFDNTDAFQVALGTVAEAGGGVVLVPPTPGEASFEIAGTVVVPHGVVLRGVEGRSRLGLTSSGATVIRFEEGAHHGGVENLILQPLGAAHPHIGIDLSGAQYLRVHKVLIRLCDTGLVLSDGITEPDTFRFAGYNFVDDFEIDACGVGILARQHCNQAAVREGRIHFARTDAGEGVGIDINGAVALSIGQVAIENFDLGVRIRGRTSVSIRDVYAESDTDPGVGSERWLDVQPDLHSIIRFENSHAEVGPSTAFAGSLEDAISTDERSSVPFGAKRHHAAAAERNLIENGDFHRADAATLIPGWSTNQHPTVVEVTNDVVSGGRSYDVTQSAHVDDALRKTFTVPESTDFVTVLVRYKNMSSTEATFRVISGANAADHRDMQPPSPDEWRIAAIAVEVDSDAHGVFDLFVIADASGGGGRIRVDEAWAVVGATAAPPRAHAHRIEFLDEPYNVVRRTGLTSSQQFAATALDGLPGLGGSPRGIIGAVLRLRGQTHEPGTGAVRRRVVRPFVWLPSATRSLDLTVRGLEQSREFTLRSTTFQDGIQFMGSDTPPTDYSIDVVGWILPS